MTTISAEDLTIAYETWQDPLYWYYSRCYDFTYHSRHLPNQTGTG